MKVLLTELSSQVKEWTKKARAEHERDITAEVNVDSYTTSAAWECRVFVRSNGIHTLGISSTLDKALEIALAEYRAKRKIQLENQ
jgi:hypothetical protein